MNIKTVVLLFSSCLAASLHGRAEGRVIINEIQTANIDQYVDPSWNYGGWVELYNPHATPFRLRGYWISDDPNNLKKHHITEQVVVYGYSYRNIWFDHHDKYCPSQVNTTLNLEGGTFYLSDENGTLVASQEYPAIPCRASWARTPNLTGEWAYCNHPTPESANAVFTPCLSRMEAPIVDCESGIFEKPFVVHVDIPEGAILRYTQDGSTPTMQNGSTSEDGAFAVDDNCVMRWALFRDGSMGSPVVTRTFLKKDKNFTLPIISIVTDPAHLYSDELGIFVKGVNGRPGLGQTDKCNWNMDWDRPVHFDYLAADGSVSLSQEAEIRRCGGWGRMQTPYSFKIHSAKQYEGVSTMDYPFFVDKPFNKTKMLLIRNGGNIDSYYRMRDCFLQKLILTSGIDIDAQDYQPVVHYINGVYKGLINMREPNNKHFVYSNYGLDEDEIDLFVIDNDSGYVQKCGTRDAFMEWYELSKQANEDSVYRRICQQVDIDEYCNYMALQLYLGNADWPDNNLKAWRPTSASGRWRHLLYDLDGCFNRSHPFTEFETFRTHVFNTLLGEPVSNYTLEIEPVNIFLWMLENARFRRRFIDAFCLVAGSVFEPTRCEDSINKWAGIRYPMQILPDNGYGKNSNPWDGASDLVSKLREQSAHMYPQLESYARFNLKDVTPQHITLSSNIETARLEINGQTVPTGYFKGRLYPPVTLKTGAPIGYVFKGWKVLSGDAEVGQAVFGYGSTWSFYDGGSLDGQSWKRLGYNTFSWSSGQSTKANNPTTSYYRMMVTLAEKPKASEMMKIKYKVRDGFVMYVNGKEAFRYRMPEGNPTFSTSAVKHTVSGVDTGSAILDDGLFREGVNLVAVEVHTSGSGTETYWDCSLVRVEPNEGDSSYVSTSEEMNLPLGDMELQACYERASSGDESGVPPVVINEISASNDSKISEYYKKSDWIELYNTTDREIDLAGMYLSDDKNRPTKYQIAGTGKGMSTTIPPHGFRVVWCDGLQPASQLHASFKLSNTDGSCLILTAPDFTWSDTLVYCAHHVLESVARYPDGGRQLYCTSIPTINQRNKVNGQSIVLDALLPENPDGISSVEGVEGFVKLRVRDNVLLVDDIVDVEVYCVDGLRVMSVHADGSVPLALLRKGVYVAVARDANGNKGTLKFTIR